MALKLITEKIEHVKSLVVEDVGRSGKSYFIEGIFLQGNKRNQNGRIYPLSTLIKEVNRYKIQNIDRKRSLGELNHPDKPTVNLDRVSHMITSLTQEGDDFVGKAKVLSTTPMGKIVTSLIDEEAELGVSSRGLGSLRETNEGTIVQEDFFMSAVDIVADPSAPDAFVRGIMEGKEWVWEAGALREYDLVEMKKAMDAVHIPTVSQADRSALFIESFSKFLAAARNGVQLKVEQS